MLGSGRTGWHSGAQVKPMGFGLINSSWRDGAGVGEAVRAVGGWWWGVGNKNLQQGATALPWRVLVSLSHALSSRTSASSQNRACCWEAASGGSCDPSTASQPIYLWLLLSPVLGVNWRGKLAPFLCSRDSPRQQNSRWKTETYKRGWKRGSVARGLTEPVGCAGLDPQCYTNWTRWQGCGLSP